MPNLDFSEISEPYKSQTLIHNLHNKISDLEFSISLHFSLSSKLEFSTQFFNIFVDS